MPGQNRRANRGEPTLAVPDDVDLLARPCVQRADCEDGVLRADIDVVHRLHWATRACNTGAAPDAGRAPSSTRSRPGWLRCRGRRQSVCAAVRRDAVALHTRGQPCHRHRQRRPRLVDGANIPYGMVRGGSCNRSADAAEGTIPSISPIAAAATAPAIHRRRIRTSQSDSAHSKAESLSPLPVPPRIPNRSCRPHRWLPRSAAPQPSSAPTAAGPGRSTARRRRTPRHREH